MKRPSMRAAINAKCKECIYDPQAMGAGTWRKQVEDCTSTDCPLYLLRPVAQKGRTDEKPANSGDLAGIPAQ